MPDGYGVCYSCQPSWLRFSITAWRSSKVADVAVRRRVVCGARAWQLGLSVVAVVQRFKASLERALHLTAGLLPFTASAPPSKL